MLKSFLFFSYICPKDFLPPYFSIFFVFKIPKDDNCFSISLIFYLHFIFLCFKNLVDDICSHPCFFF